MVVKNLSKSEYKYRYKYFYENHLNKYTQARVDELVATDPRISTYKNLYRAYREGNPFVMIMSCDLVGMSVDEVVKGYSKLNENTVDFDRAVQAFRQAAQQSAGIPICAEAIS